MLLNMTLPMRAQSVKLYDCNNTQTRFPVTYFYNSTDCTGQAVAREAAPYSRCDKCCKDCPKKRPPSGGYLASMPPPVGADDAEPGRWNGLVNARMTYPTSPRLLVVTDVLSLSLMLRHRAFLPIPSAIPPIPTVRPHGEVRGMPLEQQYLRWPARAHGSRQRPGQGCYHNATLRDSSLQWWCKPKRCLIATFCKTKDVLEDR